MSKVVFPICLPENEVRRVSDDVKWESSLKPDTVFHLNVAVFYDSGTLMARLVTGQPFNACSTIASFKAGVCVSGIVHDEGDYDGNAGSD